MVREIDLDGNDEIDFEGSLICFFLYGMRVPIVNLFRVGAEFVAVMSRKVSASYTPAQVKSAFKVREFCAGWSYCCGNHLIAFTVQLSCW